MYKDRGIIKWAPFDALLGFNQEISKILYNKYKTNKPVLLDDRIEDINNLITIAYKEKQEISILYFDDGYQKTIYGKIKLINKIKDILYLEDGFIIELSNLLDIEIL